MVNIFSLCTTSNLCALVSYTYFECADKDWDDIKFGVDNQVDYYAVSFVKDAQVVHELKDYLRSNYQF
jgi:pyruvate kinase